MSKTETGCTPKLVFNIQIEETRFTLSTLFSFHIFFADANASFRVALRWINLRARFKAIATFAARLGKVVVVVSAPVKFPLLAPKWRQTSMTPTCHTCPQLLQAYIDTFPLNRTVGIESRFRHTNRACNNRPLSCSSWDGTVRNLDRPCSPHSLNSNHRGRCVRTVLHRRRICSNNRYSCILWKIESVSVYIWHINYKFLLSILTQVAVTQ